MLIVNCADANTCAAREICSRGLYTFARDSRLNYLHDRKVRLLSALLRCAVTLMRSVENNNIICVSLGYYSFVKTRRYSWQKWLNFNELDYFYLSVYIFNQNHFVLFFLLRAAQRPALFVRPHLKHTVHLLAHALVIQVWIREFAHQLVHGSHDVRHLLPRDTAVPVDVVKRKCPAEFLVYRAARQYTQTRNKVLET